jgi:hypothetical protein
MKIAFSFCCPFKNKFVNNFLCEIFSAIPVHLSQVNLLICITIRVPESNTNGCSRKAINLEWAGHKRAYIVFNSISPAPFCPVKPLKKKMLKKKLVRIALAAPLSGSGRQVQDFFSAYSGALCG